jgi:hypothetical protein
MHRSRLSRAKRIAVATTVAVASMGAVAGAAYAAAPSGSSNTPASPTAPQGQTNNHGGYGRLARRAVHAELIVKTKTGYKTFDIDRGTINSVSTTSISITRPDGPTVTAKVDSQTKFRGKTESQLAKGDNVVVVQTGGTAAAVLSRKADQHPGSNGSTSNQSSPAQVPSAA